MAHSSEEIVCPSVYPPPETSKDAESPPPSKHRRCHMQSHFGAGNDAQWTMQCLGDAANQVGSGNVLLITDQKPIIGRCRMIQKQTDKVAKIENTHQASTVTKASEGQRYTAKH